MMQRDRHALDDKEMPQSMVKTLGGEWMPPSPMHLCHSMQNLIIPTPQICTYCAPNLHFFYKKNLQICTYCTPNILMLQSMLSTNNYNSKP